MACRIPRLLERPLGCGEFTAVHLDHRHTPPCDAQFTPAGRAGQRFESVGRPPEGTLDRSLLGTRRLGFCWQRSSGDSNSTSAIAGNLLGAKLGERAISHNWLERLELRDQIAQVADDIHAAATVN